MKFILALLLIFISFALLITSYVITPSKVLASHSRVNLLTTDNFAVLAGSAISDTGTTAIAGDVGLDPTGGASITGLTCPEVTGTIYDNNGGYAGGGGGSTACRITNAGLLTTAKNDLIAAYDDAAGRTVTATVATNLGGTTLTDGTYNSASGTFEINGGGTLTLDGGGNANAVFIFKMATTLVTSSSSRVVLTNSAQACNVYWQVGSSATLGTTTTLIGNILALTSITDDGGSTVNGRLLARNGAVTLNGTTITKQNCAAGTTGAPAVVSTSTSTSSSSSSSGGSSSSYCPPLSSTIVAPFIIESRRVSPTSIFFSWGPSSGTNAFNIQYGFEHGNWLYNTDVTGFSTTINNLPANQAIWVQIAGRSDCRIGSYGVSKLIGGSIGGPTIVGQNPNVLEVSFPNTGFASLKHNTPWYIPAGIFVGILIPLFKFKNIIDDHSDTQNLH